ncbi:hypothetical protein LCL97_05050 [Seohaeicola saemankumensis]|nr:calcium-binding protein [Seohaeicola saemankumensis]MCA0870177.1 hypothetical protein [Seohaeicola saemankumensis]
MAVTFVTFNSVGTGVRYDLGATDYEGIFISDGATVASTTTVAIQGSGDYQTVQVRGELLTAGSNATYLQGDYSTVSVFEGGLVSAVASYYGAAAMYFTGAFNDVYNSGEISGNDGLFFSNGGATVMNSGVIQAIGTPAYYLWGAAIQLGSNVQDDPNANLIVNTGIIQGENYAIQGEANYYYHAYETIDVVQNWGLIIGEVNLASRDDTVVNGGTIIGDVNLGDDNDTYVGRDGSIVDGIIDGGDGNDTLKGGSNADTLVGSGGKDTIRGRGGDDTIDGGNQADTLFGGGGDDTIDGGNGKDIIDGGSGDDTIDGGDSNDVINGGTGNDTITGGAGADDFVFGLDAGNDVITDFGTGADQLDLSAYNITAFADVSAAATDGPTGMMIDLTALGGSGTLLLEGFSTASFDAADVIL